MSVDIARALQSLRNHYEIALPEPREAFALIVWENCAYLVDDEKRARTFQRLSAQIGITPAVLRAAGVRRIEKAIEGGGMKASHRAAKVLQCAEIALEHEGEEISRKYLKRFPGIADPGADKVLLLCGYASAPALDSNGLRVLERWGTVLSGQQYAAAYRGGTATLANAGIAGAQAIEAFALLRAHGRELCKRAAPLCGPCPVRDCPSRR